MDFRIADTFTDSLSRLTSDEQKAVKTTAFDLHMNRSSSGMGFHKLAKAKNGGFIPRLSNYTLNQIQIRINRYKWTRSRTPFRPALDLRLLNW